MLHATLCLQFDVFKMGDSQLEEFHGISLIFGESWAGPVASFKASSKSWVLSEIFLGEAPRVP